MTPLTPEQQALCVQWKGLACKYTLKMMGRRASLAHMMDEAESIAFEALCRAALAWRPDAAPFPACLKWWVKSFVNLADRHHGRVVRHSEKREGPMPLHAFSLNATMHSGQTASSTSGQATDVTFMDALADEDANPVDVDVEIHNALEALVEYLEVALKARGLSRQKKRREYIVRTSIEWWLSRSLDEEGFDSIAKRHRVSRQAVQQRVSRVDRLVERWAEKVKREAA